MDLRKLTKLMDSNLPGQKNLYHRAIFDSVRLSDAEAAAKKSKKLYNADYIISNPPRWVDEDSLWEQAVNKATNHGSKEVEIIIPLTLYKKALNAKIKALQSELDEAEKAMENSESRLKDDYDTDLHDADYYYDAIPDWLINNEFWEQAVDEATSNGKKEVTEKEVDEVFIRIIKDELNKSKSAVGDSRIKDSYSYDELWELAKQASKEEPGKPYYTKEANQAWKKLRELFFKVGDYRDVGHTGDHLIWEDSRGVVSEVIRANPDPEIIEGLVSRLKQVKDDEDNGSDKDPEDDSEEMEITPELALDVLVYALKNGMSIQEAFADMCENVVADCADFNKLSDSASELDKAMYFFHNDWDEESGEFDFNLTSDEVSQLQDYIIDLYENDEREDYPSIFLNKGKVKVVVDSCILKKKVQDISEEEQTDKLKTEMYYMVLNQVRKHYREYLDPKKYDPDELASEFYAQFLEKKSREKGKEQSLLDKFDPSVTNLPYLVKVAVQRKLIDKARTDKGEMNYSEEYDEETGDLSLNYLASKIDEPDVNIDAIEFDEDTILELRDKFDEMDPAKKKAFLKYYDEVKDVLSSNFKSLFQDLVGY